MFTVCPKCTLTLAVTAEDLRAGQGYVRCGRCLNVFNALLALSEETHEDEAAPAYSQADPASSSQITRALASAGETIAPPAPPSLVSAEAERAPLQLPTEVSSDGAIENESTHAEGTGTFETIVLEGDAITQTEEFAPQESVDYEIAALAQRLAVHSQQDAPDEEQLEPMDESTEATTAADIVALLDSEPHDPVASRDATSSGQDATTRESTTADDAAQSEPAAIAEADASDLYTPRPARRQVGAAVGSALLALLLLTQFVNHWRDSLAMKPALSAPLTRLYGALGMPLDPHWDLSAYDVRQQGAASDPGDSHLIRVRLSLANRAPRPQPVPLLRLTLLDRYGKRVAARDLTPADYWPHDQPVHAFLGHDERIDSEVAVRDPGADSASFELDVCLRNLHGTVRCAGDLIPTEAGAT
jgi:predicted Zn finger-like uncharacterized protein